MCVLKKEAAVQILGMCKNQRALFISQKLQLPLDKIISVSISLEKPT
jgi:hypothetical protein